MYKKIPSRPTGNSSFGPWAVHPPPALRRDSLQGLGVASIEMADVWGIRLWRFMMSYVDLWMFNDVYRISNNNYIYIYVLVGDFSFFEKYDFVSWDDEIPN